MAEHERAQEESIAGFVLAGGRSSRMGTDKARAPFHGVPLIQIAVQILVEAGIPARIAGSRSDLSEFAQEIPDQKANSGPLSGVHAALSVSRADWNVFLPVDMPLMPTSLIRCLAERARLTGAPVTAATLHGRLEPFPVVLHRDVFPFIGQRLMGGKAACHAAWQEIPGEVGSFLDSPAVEHLAQCGQCADRGGLAAALWFHSANTPADLALLNRLRATREAISADSEVRIRGQGDGESRVLK